MKHETAGDPIPTSATEPKNRGNLLNFRCGNPKVFTTTPTDYAVARGIFEWIFGGG